MDCDSIHCIAEDTSSLNDLNHLVLVLLAHTAHFQMEFFYTLVRNAIVAHYSGR